MRQKFVMTDEQYAAIRKASKPTPVMYLSGGQSMFDSPQQNANRAWRALANDLGFVWDTAQPVTGEPLAFTAEVEEAKR